MNNISELDRIPFDEQQLPVLGTLNPEGKVAPVTIAFCAILEKAISSG